MTLAASRVDQAGDLIASAREAAIFDREQRATHGLAWLATYVEALCQLASYAERMQAAGRLGEPEDLLVRIGLGEYLAQIIGGIPMSQGEIVRPRALGSCLTASAWVAGNTTIHLSFREESSSG